MKNIRPTAQMVITEDTRFEPGVYLLPEGITIAANGVTLDGAGAQLIGVNRQGVGLEIKGARDVTVKNLQISNYYHGIRAADCQNLTLKHCKITETAEAPANATPLDVWREAHQAYGSAILLEGVSKSRLLNNDLQHQMNGLLTYYCRELSVEGNNASYNSGFGFHLYETCQSTFQNNWADHCGRLSAKPEGQLGAASAGFLIAHHASQNSFIGNSARLCGNGFRLAGMTPTNEWVPCNDNRFENCDGSYSPNAAFEATFSQGNHFRNNQASHANYGFWLAFSRETELHGNTIQGNHRAGIAAENGVRFRVENNTLQDNHFGLLVWSRPVPAFLKALPENDTSKFWLIQGNSLHRNHTALRIAANQDHGTMPWKELQNENPETYLRPHDHEIRQNDIAGNRLGIQTVHCDRTTVQDNTFSLNLVGDIKS